MRAISLQPFVLAVEILVLGCSANPGVEPQGDGGSSATGGSLAHGGTPTVGAGGATVNGGSNAGGALQGGGGAPNGGAVGTGGHMAAGGSATGGGAPGGGAANGGAANGGAANGGAANGGAANGGATHGGNANGGAANGGAAHGGNANGGNGNAGTGGTASAGSSAGGGTAVNCSGPALTGGTQHCSSNATGNAGSFSYSIWSSGSGGCITTYGSGAAFKATWNNSGDFLAGMGFQWNETKKYDQYGTISADYSYTKTGSAGGYSYLGIYGWSNSPLIEFYIVDDWFGSNPPTGGGTLKGTFDVDGGTYKVYTHQQVNQPSIHGTTTFNQYFSVRQTARQCGHISLTAHFSEWASLNMPLGVMASARLLAEAGGGVGSIDYKSAAMTAQ